VSLIHEHFGCPRGTWDAARIAYPLAAVRHRQGRLLGRVDGLGFDIRRDASIGTLADDIVKSSAIEGVALPFDEARSSIARRLGIEIGGSSSRREVEGFVEMMLDATRDHAQPLTPERRHVWHAALFPTGRSGIRRIAVGAWRDSEADAMQVVSGPVGRERVHSKAPAAHRLESEIGAFLGWFNGAESGPGSFDPVVKPGLAHFWFVTIHPFEDGNGGIARAIADLTLARADGTAERFYSMSARIEAERRDYCAALGASNARAWT
jgi:Fic family protein